MGLHKPPCIDPALWDKNHIPGKLIFKLNPGIKYRDVLNILGRHGARRHHCSDHLGGTNTYAVELTGDSQVLAAELIATGMVAFAEPDRVASVRLIPNDAGYPSQYWIQQIGIAEAYDITVGSSALMIASIDTHFYLAHPDMAGKFTSNGWNFTNGNATLDDPGTCSDTEFHGCLTAAVLGAATFNMIGIASVSPNTLIMPLQAADSNVTSNPNISTTSAIAAIYYAVKNGAQGITMSFGFTGVNTGFQEAIAFASFNGLLLGASTSNNGDTINYNPGAYPGVMCVGSVDAADARSSFSSYGTSVDVASPGSAPFLTLDYNGGTTTAWQGCSFSAPAVVGAGASMMGLGIATADQIQSILTSTAGGDPTTGFTNGPVSRVNVPKALNAVLALRVPSVPVIWSPSYDAPVYC